MKTLFTTSDFASLHTDVSVIELTESHMNERLSRFCTLYLKGNLYMICRLVYDMMMKMNDLTRHNDQLSKEVVELRSKVAKLEAAKTTVKTVNCGAWIDNGQPGEDWRTIHEMGC